jgi:hypothetical protein
MATHFTNEVRKLATEKDEYLSAVQHRYLKQLADAPGLENIWKRIEKNCGKKCNLAMRYFIRDIVHDRSFAAMDHAWPDFLAHAKNTERVVRFLKGSAPLPPPMPEFLELVPNLEDMASRSKERARRGFHISRETGDGVRQYVLFMQWASLTMHDHFKHWLDNEVAEITNIFFPKAEVTNDSVRAARRRNRIRLAA